MTTKLEPMVPMLKSVPIPPMTTTRAAPACNICGKDQSTVELRRAYNGRDYRCRPCQAAVLREIQVKEARKGLEPLLDSLPLSRDNDDESMLAQAEEKLRRFHAGWTRKVGLAALIVGLSGSRKTLVAVSKIRVMIDAAIADCINNGGKSEDLEWIGRAYFVTAFQICEATRQHPLGQGECPEVTKARRASLLVLDDIGNENTGFEKWLLSVIDSRIAAHRPTWVTSGYSVEQLSERYGQALVRRLCEKGTGTLIDLFRAGAALKAVR